jgi:hypothetical protein
MGFFAKIDRVSVILPILSDILLSRIKSSDFSFHPSKMISSKEAVCIAEIVIFVPLYPLALYLTYRHSFYKQLAWFFLFLLCQLRIASGGLAIATVHNPQSIPEAVSAAILGSVGLSPLLLGTMGLLKIV